MRKRRRYWWLFIPLLLIVLFLAGPKPPTPVYSTEMPVVPAAPDSLERYIRIMESWHHLKPDNEARIVWADSTKRKTRYAIVYLHGFSASQGEGGPVHRYIASRYGCNLYLSRLAEHGIDTTDAMAGLTADEYWESAKQALAIGRQLGDSVILMGTSTGGTQALQLAAAFPNQVAALVLMSPNIAINDPNAWVTNQHWGLAGTSDHALALCHQQRRLWTFVPAILVYQVPYRGRGGVAGDVIHDDEQEHVRKGHAARGPFLLLQGQD